MIKDYLNQTLIWGQAGEPDVYNEIPFTNVFIKGRKEEGFKLIRNSQGQEVVSSACVFTDEAVKVGDKVDGRIVLSAQPMNDLDGSILFREVYLI